jgi:RNA polymerase sigma factor (sigma-70 family)
MDTLPALKKEWVLTQDAFDKLLACLDPNPDKAAENYEDIRQSLITFFICRGSYSPEEHADETINRVAKKLAEGKQIYTPNPASYFYGVARNILKEHWEAPDRLSYQIETLQPDKQLSVDMNELHEQDVKRCEQERRLECLERCLEGLAPLSRQLITHYYEGKSNEKIKNRKMLAEQSGVSLNALRNKALRIREKLENCLHDCLKRSR